MAHKEMKKRISQSLPLALATSSVLCVGTIAQQGDSEPSARASAIVPDRRERFIAAVDWFVDRTPEFVWPFESMQPAPFESVRMVVESMPWSVIGGGKDRRSEPLLASRHLRINGRLQKAIRVTRATSNQPEQREFLVKLDGGRLRLRLVVPAGTTFDSKALYSESETLRSLKAAGKDDETLALRVDERLSQMADQFLRRFVSLHDLHDLRRRVSHV